MMKPRFALDLAGGGLCLLALLWLGQAGLVELPAYPVCFASTPELLGLPDPATPAEVAEACLADLWVDSTRYANQTCFHELRDWFDGHVEEACRQFQASGAFIRQSTPLCFAHTECTPDPTTCPTTPRGPPRFDSKMALTAVAASVAVGLCFGTVFVGVTAAGWVVFWVADALWALLCRLAALPPLFLAWIVRTVPLVAAYAWTALVSLATATRLELERAGAALAAAWWFLLNLPWAAAAWARWLGAAAAEAGLEAGIWAARTALWTAQALATAGLQLARDFWRFLVQIWYIVAILSTIQVVTVCCVQLARAVVQPWKNIVEAAGYIRVTFRTPDEDLSEEEKAELVKTCKALWWASLRMLRDAIASILYAALRFLVLTGGWALLVYGVDRIMRA